MLTINDYSENAVVPVETDPAMAQISNQVMLGRLNAIFATYRFNLACESTLQREISDALTESGIAHQREVVLSDKDRIDFMIGGIGVEVKIKGSGRSIHRQCTRYCEQPMVKILVLVTNRSMGFPATIAGTPCYLFSLGCAGL